MTGDGKSDKSSAATSPRRFNPLWILDAGGAVGIVLFTTGAALASSGWSWLKEIGLLLFGCWVVVRALELVIRNRDGREVQRRELLRRMAVLNDSLLDLRKSLSRDFTRRFLDRRDDFEAGVKLAKLALTPKETELAKKATDFCARMSDALSDTVHRRADVSQSVDRLRREVERAARRGDLDQHDADDLIDIVGDAVQVLDEAIYAEWNADHFGRLTADQRHFARELDRYKSQAAGEIERRGRDLFEELFTHVRQKVEVVDMVAEWEDLYRKLEAMVSGLEAHKPKPRGGPGKDKEEKPKAKPSDRFPMLVVKNEGGGDDDGGRRLRHRLPAAND